MKSTVLWILRYLFLPVGFIWATGFINGVISVSHIELPPDPFRTFSKEEISTLCISPENFRAFSDSLVKTRERYIEDTGFYEPYLYFSDLKQITMFEVVFRDTLDQTGSGRLMFLGISWMKDRLVALRGDNWRHFENLEKIRADSIPGSMSVSEATHFWFPKTKVRETEIAEMYFMEDVGWPVIDWFFRFYLKGLPFAFVLFLFWRFRFKEEVDDACYGELRDRLYFDMGFAPLSFFFSILFWPFILLADMKNRLVESFMKAEVLSRRKDMLSVFSKQDKKLLALGRQMSFREFRIHLDTLGMRRRHSFASALFVVLFFASVQKVFSFPNYQLSESDITTHIVASSGDADVGWNYALIDYLDCAVTPSIDWAEKVIKFKNIFSSSRIKTFQGFARLLEGVPKVSKSFTFELIS